MMKRIGIVLTTMLLALTGAHTDANVTTYVNQGAFSWDSSGSRHTGFVVRTYPDRAMTTTFYSGTTRKGEGLKVQERSGTIKLAML